MVLKPLEERKISAAEVIDREAATGEGSGCTTLYLQPAQDITIGARIAKTQYQYTLYGTADLRELNHWVEIFLTR